MLSAAAPVDMLFDSVVIRGLELPNRIVMPPMGFHTANDGVPGLDVANYYRQRAAGGAGLILTEGVFIDHPTACDNPLLLRFDSHRALQGWQEVVRQVHGAAGRIMPELWHVGLIPNQNELLKGAEAAHDPGKNLIGPSGLIMPGRKVLPEMDQDDIDGVIDAFARGAVEAQKSGFDGVELHGAHGYLIDQFFWDGLNIRTDHYGGTMRNRARFCAEIVAEIRHRVGSDFPILLRISQWKLQDYAAKVARSVRELEDWIDPLVTAGVDVFDCSQRRFWEPEFEGSELNLAGWVKKISGKPTITVGSVGLNRDMVESLGSAMDAAPASLDPLMARLARGEFDLIAVGRALIADPYWPTKVRQGRMDELKPFNVSILAESPSHADLSGV